jgi:hypothetical protein
LRRRADAAEIPPPAGSSGQACGLTTLTSGKVQSQAYYIEKAYLERDRQEFFQLYGLYPEHAQK